MHRSIIAVLILICAKPVFASDSCGLRVAKLFADGEIEKLSELFLDGQKASPSISALRDRLGVLERLKEVSAPRFAKHLRYSYSEIVPTSSEKYIGYWINAESEKLGPVQMHVAKASNGECRLVALHVDFDK